jgi:hypothetical protein
MNFRPPHREVRLRPLYLTDFTPREKTCGKVFALLLATGPPPKLETEMKTGRHITHVSEEAGDRRACSRFKLRGEAWFRWETAHGEQGSGEGTTREIGKSGAFIETAKAPPVAAQVRLVVTLRSRLNEDMSVCLCGAGCVRHVRSDDGVVVGFGAEVPFHTEAPARTG